MSIRFWLKANAEQVIRTEHEKKRSNVMADVVFVSHLNGLQVRDDEGGVKYIDWFADPINPASSMPNIDRKYVKRVSFVGNYHEGFRTEGMYTHKGAIARVMTKYSFHGGDDYYMSRGEVKEEVYQQISISAGSVKTLREIYSKVREGELKPDKNWGIPRHELERRERQAVAGNESTQTAH